MKKIFIVLILFIAALIVLAKLRREREWPWTFTKQALVVESNMKQTYTAIFSNVMPMSDEQRKIKDFLIEGPDGRFQSSTEYLEYLITNEIILVDPSEYFGGPGLGQSRSNEENEFGSHNNAWCVVPDAIVNAEVGTPIFFTRNVHVSRLGGELTSVDIHGPPFGKKGAVVLMYGGKAKILERESEVVEFFSSLSATNQVLRP